LELRYGFKEMQLTTIQNFEPTQPLPALQDARMEETVIDASGSYFPELIKKTPGDIVNYWKPDLKRAAHDGPLNE
jgi:hypothetical protein